MSKTTKLRLVGAAIFLFNLWMVGRFNMDGPAVAVVTIGFVISYEYFVVRNCEKNRAATKDGNTDDLRNIVSSPNKTDVLVSEPVTYHCDNSPVARAVLISVVAIAVLLFMLFILAAIVTGA